MDSSGALCAAASHRPREHKGWRRHRSALRCGDHPAWAAPSPTDSAAIDLAATRWQLSCSSPPPYLLMAVKRGASSPAIVLPCSAPTIQRAVHRVCMSTSIGCGGMGAQLRKELGVGCRTAHADDHISRAVDVRLRAGLRCYCQTVFRGGPWTLDWLRVAASLSL